jgi:uncharacterized protein YmfQ (DUF2313 family)
MAMTLFMDILIKERRITIWSSSMIETLLNRIKHTAFYQKVTKLTDI